MTAIVHAIFTPAPIPDNETSTDRGERERTDAVRKDASFLTLERMRGELRIPDGDTEHDALIAQITEDAIAEVSNDAKIPILQRKVVAAVAFPGNPSAPIVFTADKFAVAFDSLYAAEDVAAATAEDWTVPVALGTVTGIVDGAEADIENVRTPSSLVKKLDNNILRPTTDADGEYPLNRLFDRLILYPPADGWAQPLGGVFGLYYERGILSDSELLGQLRAMTILKARAAYDGMAFVPETGRSAYERILVRVENFQSPVFASVDQQAVT